MKQVGHYRIEAELGRGGMGIVYRAIDTRLGRRVAIKMLPAEATADADRHQRFIQEARSASALNHPNSVTIYDIGENGGETFIAMELVEGVPLDTLLAKGPLPVALALHYAEQAASALAAAHATGIVHRDIKPANIVITPDGRPKVLDFGLAKLMQRGASEATLTALATSAGSVMGTPAYMSPEQAEGHTVDARSDVFSMGAVLYEMLAGRRPFSGSSNASLMSAILRDPPAPLRVARPDTPPAVDAIVTRALSKNPAERYDDGGAMRAALAAVSAQLARPAESAWRKPAVAAVVLLLLGAVAFATWQTVSTRRARWVQRVALPDIERLQFTDRSLDAVRLARQAEHYAGPDIARVKASWFAFDTNTEPEGAEVSVRNYLDVDGAWEPLGRTPVQGHFLPQGLYRLRVSKPGYLPMDVSYSGGRPTIKLVPESTAVPGMMFVPAGPVTVGVAGTMRLPDYWIDKYEVTNAEFKHFVDAGGYTDAKYWQEPLVEGTRILSFAEAIARFTDNTGRAGPATWEIGSYPDGRQDFPVAGISWFEAAAYARFSGKSLPTMFHWRAASGTDEIFSDMLRVSQFESKGPAKVGQRQSVGPWGTFDMAGNVQEWCVNEAGTTGLRYIVGGGWNDPAYRFREPEGRNPWDRAATFGVRLIKNAGTASAELGAPIAHVEGDPASLVPVNDEQFALLRQFYSYDHNPVDGRVDAVDDSSPHWRKETVSFAAAYGGERVPAYLFLPNNARPPFQTVVFVPTSYAREVPSSQALDLVSFDFIVRSGRAVLYPVYWGTFERKKPEPPGPNGVRDRFVLYAKDVFRAVDYLATRDDIDRERVGYFGLSHGAFFGPIPVALEPRIKAAVFAAGGLRYGALPETQTVNFMPRITVPVLIVNGRDDFAVSTRDQQRFHDLLGTAADRKQSVRLEGGHVPSDMNAFFRVVLNWFDKYLGVVK
ncbi:hypothetical protein BH18ACI5_BH18ACI5_09800 [soil metagenome]